MKVNYIKYWRKSSLKKKKDGNFLLNHIRLKKPKNFLEIGVFHGVTSRNVCELLYSFYGNDFKFTGSEAGVEYVAVLFSTETSSFTVTPSVTLPFNDDWDSGTLRAGVSVNVLF